MLHVRVVCPAPLTQSLTDRLAAAPGVHNVVVRTDAARRPDGDAVEFDVRDAVANPVFTARCGGRPRQSGRWWKRVPLAPTMGL